MKKTTTIKKGIIGIGDINQRTVKLKIKSTGNNISKITHTNFYEEIQAREKSDKFLNTIFYIGYAILVVLAITYIILK